MKIQITKRKDGGTVLKCVRADGSETWQKVEGRQAQFFPFHDLTHYAVESELGVRDAFFDLIAQGWSIDETGRKRAEGELPEGAHFAENLVGTLDRERASLTTWTAEEF